MDAALARAGIVILLVSPNYLASNPIATGELPQVLQAERKEGLRIIPVAVSAIWVRDSPLAEFQFANDVNKPLDTLPLSRLNGELVRIAQQVRRLAQGPESG